MNAPLYLDVRRKILTSITLGHWPTGTPLPNETKLAREFGVSVGTLRKAVDELVQDKILARQQGRGTFVATHNVERTLHDFFRIRHNDGISRFPEIKTLSLRKIAADEEASQRLQLSNRAKVYRIINLLTVGGLPAALDQIFLPAERFDGLSLDLFSTRTGTIYHLYQNSFGVNVLKAEEQVRACKCGAKESRALGIPRATIMLEVERISRTYYDVPVEWRRTRVNTQHHYYSSELG
jgi:GntR family transcriptional regulator